MSRIHLHSNICTDVFENIRDPLLVVDAEGDILLYNWAAAGVFDTSSMTDVASLGVFGGYYDFHFSDVLALINPGGVDIPGDLDQAAGRSRRDDVINYQLKDSDGNETPIYLDIIRLSHGSEATAAAAAAEMPEPQPLSEIPGIRFALEDTDQDSLVTGDELILLRFRDLTDFRRKEKWRDELISMVSHDIRNPLSAIRNSVSLLLTEVPDPLTPVQEKFLKTATRSIDRLTHLLDGVLDISRIDSGMFKLTPAWLDLEKFVKDVFTSFETLYNVKRVNLSLEIAGEIERIYADADKLEQVLFNLLSNALKFTPEGGNITLTVRQAGVEVLDEQYRLLPWRDLPDPKLVIFKVKDTGLGMNQKTLVNLFSRYYEDPSGQGSKGSHLGMSISKMLVEAQGGSIDVNSQLGIGTEVTVMIPADERTGYILGCVKSVRAHLERLQAEGRPIAFYSIGKDSGDCWMNLARNWSRQPVINPGIEEHRWERFFMWTLSEYLAVAMVVTDDAEDIRRDLLGGEDDEFETAPYQATVFGADGALYGKAAHYDGYNAGVCLAPEEGESLARLFNISLKRMADVNRLGQQVDH
jgi:signal transduction histidine kinase